MTRLTRELWRLQLAGGLCSSYLLVSHVWKLGLPWQLSGKGEPGNIYWLFSLIFRKPLSQMGSMEIFRLNHCQVKGHLPIFLHNCMSCRRFWVPLGAVLSLFACKRVAFVKGGLRRLVWSFWLPTCVFTSDRCEWHFFTLMSPWTVILCHLQSPLDFKIWPWTVAWLEENILSSYRKNTKDPVIFYLFSLDPPGEQMGCYCSRCTGGYFLMPELWILYLCPCIELTAGHFQSYAQFRHTAQ
jgi:hypothetical protein